MPVIGSAGVQQPWVPSRSLDPRNYGAGGTGNTDDTAALQSALNASVTAGGIVDVGPGIYNHTLITVPADVELRIRPGTTLRPQVATEDGIRLGARSRLTGGGTIESPATWDGTNVGWTFAVVKLLGHDAVVEDVTLKNIPKVGIAVQEADNVRICGNRITGNYPANLWTEFETVHFGVVFDASAATDSGRSIVSGNHFKSCVQGVFIGNRSAGFGVGITITGNTFDGCHNHGVYCGGAWSGLVITSNAFAHCSRPVTIQGNGHLVAGNTMWTESTGTNLDTPGIAVREASDCLIANNIIKGDGRDGFVIIDVQNNNGTLLEGNRIVGNVVDITGGSVIGIRVGTPPQTVTARNNVIQDNYVRCADGLSSASIALYGNATTPGTHNTVSRNVIVVRGPQNAINVSSQDHATVSDNNIQFEYDSPSAITVGGVSMSATRYSRIERNTVTNPAAYGTNVTVRGAWEKTGSVENSIIDNPFRPDLTKLAAAAALVLLATSGSLVSATGPGAPTTNAAVGSRWWRSDGAAATTLYVKETGTAAAGWVGK